MSSSASSSVAPATAPDSTFLSAFTGVLFGGGCYIGGSLLAHAAMRELGWVAVVAVTALAVLFGIGLIITAAAVAPVAGVTAKSQKKRVTIFGSVALLGLAVTGYLGWTLAQNTSNDDVPIVSIPSYLGLFVAFMVGFVTPLVMMRPVQRTRRLVWTGVTWIGTTVTGYTTAVLIWQFTELNEAPSVWMYASVVASAVVGIAAPVWFLMRTARIAATETTKG